MVQKEDSLKMRINKELKQLLEERGIDVDKIVIFGSYARGTDKIMSFLFAPFSFLSAWEFSYVTNIISKP